MGGPCRFCGRPGPAAVCGDCVGMALTPAANKRLAKRVARAASAAGTGPESVSESAPQARRGIPNRTESRFSESVLSVMLARGQIIRAEFEPITFHVHGVGKYTPDWVGTLPDNRLWCWEVKGSQRMNDGSVLRLKVHAAARPWIRFTMVQRDGGTFRVLHDLNATGPVQGSHG